jgi:C4-dicarboxylate-specific signal transduction histidine kinase
MPSGGRMSSLLKSGSAAGTAALVLRYGVPVVSTAVALLVTQVLGLSVFPTPLFFAAVVASTWYGNVRSGLLAVLLAILALDHYFIPAPRTMGAALPHLLQFALPALLTCWFVKKRREAELSLRAARDELEVKVQARTSELRMQIAERVKAEETVHKTQTQLAHVNRVMTMGELATSIAHELNQPLMAVVVNGDACLRWLDSTTPNLEEARAAVARMVSESARASAIITRIRALSQNSSAQKDRVDLHGVIAEILALASGELTANNIAVVTDLAGDLPPVCGDRVQLQQVLLNLVMNAIDAMCSLTDASRELRISTGVHGRDAVIVSVRDSGVGLPKQDVDRIFDAFITTKPHGVGMGLSISRTIVEAHAGRLWSEDARPGAIFHFTIPMYA